MENSQIVDENVKFCGHFTKTVLSSPTLAFSCNPTVMFKLLLKCMTSHKLTQESLFIILKGSR